MSSRLRASLICSLLVLVSCARRPSEVYVIANGYVGWIRVEFNVPGAPPLQLHEGKYLIRVPPSGMVQTSTPFEEGAGNDQFYYDAAGSRIRLPIGDATTRRGNIWGIGTASTASGSNPPRIFREFFVGSFEAFTKTST